MWALSVDSFSTYFDFKCGSEEMGFTGLAARLEDAFTKAKTLVAHRRDKVAYIMGFSLDKFDDRSQQSIRAALTWSTGFRCSCKF